VLLPAVLLPATVPEQLLATVPGLEQLLDMELLLGQGTM